MIFKSYKTNCGCCCCCFCCCCVTIDRVKESMDEIYIMSGRSVIHGHLPYILGSAPVDQIRLID